MLLLIDKPKGMTSHDVVDEVRRATGVKRVGHAGTLDPNATGLLIVGVGREFTKKLGFLTKSTPKTYDAEIILGEERDTDDVEGEVVKKTDKIVKRITKNSISNVLKQFKGELMQDPPIYSAIKVNGKKAYELARKKINPNLGARRISVYSIKLLDFNYPSLKIRCKVSPGTYIRALARDIGRQIGTFGYLSELRRTKIGKFSVEKAISLQDLKKMQQ